MAKCELCGIEYEPKRVTSKYCSAKCRKLAFLSVPEISVPLSVPEPIKLKLKEGKLVVNRKPGGAVTKAEIDALPAEVKANIARLCKSNPQIYGNPQVRLERAVMYHRIFPYRASG